MGIIQDLPKGTVFLERYDFNCAQCSHSMSFKPSLMMIEFRRNSGHATCPKCKTFLRLFIDSDYTRGASMVWDDYLKSIIEKAESENEAV